MNHSQPTRGGFRSRRGFLLACSGASLGMGGFWRLSGMAARYGGVAVLLPFLLFAALIAVFGLTGELALGRRFAAGPAGAFASCAGTRKDGRAAGMAVGMLPVLCAAFPAVFCTVLAGWSLRYFSLALSGELYSLGADSGALSGVFGAVAPETVTFRGAVRLMLSAHVFGIGNGVWQLAVSAAVFAILSLGVARGIERMSRITTPLLLLLLSLLAVRVALLPGAEEGFRRILVLKPEALSDPKVWLLSLAQAFCSLSVAGGVCVTYGSYCPEDTDLPGSARAAALLDAFAALLTVLVILPAMAAGNAVFPKGGAELLFVSLAGVFNTMPDGRAAGALFFFCVLLGSLGSLVSLYEVPTAFLRDTLRCSRPLAAAIVCAGGGGAALLVQPWATRWTDAMALCLCPLGALLSGLMFFRILRKDDALRSAGRNGDRFGRWFYPLGRFVYCPLVLAALLAGILLIVVS